MKNIFTSKWHGRDESIERVHVYEFDNVDEFWKFEDMTFDEKCDLFDVHEDHYVAHGAIYYRYDFYNTTYHAVMFETKAINV
jgi:hypothetical protein